MCPKLFFYNSLIHLREISTAIRGLGSPVPMSHLKTGRVEKSGDAIRRLFLSEIAKQTIIPHNDAAIKKA